MMNRKAKKGQHSFYMLIYLLFEETVQVNIQVHLVFENKITHHEHYKSAKSSQISSTIGMTTQNGEKHNLCY